MTEELNQQLAPIEEKMTQELVKANVTEAVISTLRERYLPLKIAGLEDKETYLLVKEGRKECKSLRVMAKKICTNGREEATAIQKAWIAKEKEVTGKIAEVEDYLEAQEKEYEAGIAAEKEARKRKQEEQLILRQQQLTAIGALYSEGSFILGDVWYEYSAIRESEDDIWNENIYPSFYAEYQKIQAEELLKEQQRKEAEAELKRHWNELELERKRLEEKEAELKLEAERQSEAAKKAIEAKISARCDQVESIGLAYNTTAQQHIGYGCVMSVIEIRCDSDDEWNAKIESITAEVKRRKEEEAEEKRKEQERKELQNKRYAELLPLNEYGVPVEMDNLWSLSEELYSSTLGAKRAAFDRAEEEKAKEIAEKAAKAERERIEEEQRQAEVKRKEDLRKSRFAVLNQHELVYFNENGHLEYMTEDEWMVVFNKLKSERDELIRKHEEERKAEELAKASDKEKWEQIIADIISLGVVIDSLPMRSGQYRKKAAILREKLEEIKAL